MKFKTKGFISLLLACSFTVAAFSGCILYLTPRGRTANWSGWTMAGLDKFQWAAIHINACLLVLVVAAFHLVWNWKVFWSYIKKRSAAGLNLKSEMAVALLSTAALVAGTLYDVPPLSYPIALKWDIKEYWERETSREPAHHAEEFSVARFARTVEQPPGNALVENAGSAGRGPMGGGRGMGWGNGSGRRPGWMRGGSGSEQDWSEPPAKRKRKNRKTARRTDNRSRQNGP